MNIEMIDAAEARLAGNVRKTPMLGSTFLDEIAGRRLLVKAECLQETGAFKLRGAWSAISALSDEERARGILACSSGNHAQAVAITCARFGIPAVIVMPADAPRLKLDNTRAYGAEIVTYDRASEDRDALSKRLAKERGLTLVLPYDDPQVIAGQGTCGLEIAAQAQEFGVTKGELLVCCGGGGLTAGIAMACAARAPGLRPRTVEPEGFDDVRRSLELGRIDPNPTEAGTICDAISTRAPGKITFPIIQELCGPGMAVTEDEVLRAMGLAFQRLKLVIEPGGAVALAAALFHPDQIEGDAVIAVASGGNVDPQMFGRALQTL